MSPQTNPESSRATATTAVRDPFVGARRRYRPCRRSCAFQQPSSTLEELQGKLDFFRTYYNTERPHPAIGRRTPTEAFEAPPRAVPPKAGFVVPGHYRVRQDRVDRGGTVTLRYNSRLHHIGLGRRYAGARVLLLAAGLEVRIVIAGDRGAPTGAHAGPKPRLPTTGVKVEGCPETSGNDVARRDTSAPGGTPRTWAQGRPAELGRGLIVRESFEVAKTKGRRTAYPS